MKPLSLMVVTLFASVAVLLAGSGGVVLAAGMDALPPIDLRLQLGGQSALLVATPTDCPSGLSAATCATYADELPRALHVTYAAPSASRPLLSAPLPKSFDLGAFAAWWHYRA